MTNTQNNPPAGGGSLIDALARLANASVAPVLSNFSQLQQQRADQLTAVAKRLKGSLGKDHPQVAELTQQAAAAASFQQALTNEATRAARLPQVSGNDWLVYGRVFDPQGKPLSGLTVRVFDREQQYKDLLGETTTDEFGDFSLTYHEHDFAKLGKAQPDLFLTVQDAAGTQLFSSEEKVKYEPGRVEYFEIVLKETPKTPPKPTRSGGKRRGK